MSENQFRLLRGFQQKENSGGVTREQHGSGSLKRASACVAG
jgi:hypothetical protein